MEERSPLVSIIVPVFKVEKYLSRCVDSICAQTYQNIEIILVDDGSPDKCGKICDDHAVKDSRIHVIHKENEGLAVARNIGVRDSHGAYISFVDSDDYVRSDFVEKMLGYCIEYKSDVSQCLFEKGRADKFSLENEEPDVKKLDYVTAFTRKERLNISPCNKLYKKTMLDLVTFPEGKRNEDEFFTYKVVYYAQSIVVTNERLYYYYSNSSSIMRNKSKNDKPLDFLDAMEERLIFFKDKNEPVLVSNSIIEFCLKIIIFYSGCKKTGTNKKDLSKLKDLYREYYAMLTDFGNLSPRFTFPMRMFKTMPEVTAMIISVIKS